MDTLYQKLRNKPQVFDLFQAIRCLKLILGGAKINCHAAASFTFPISDIAAIQQNATGEVILQSSWGGLYGVNGLLPLHYTELLFARLREKDAHLRDFFDKLNHYLISLCYQSWQSNRFYIGYEAEKYESESNNHFKQLLQSLVGQAVPITTDRLAITHENFLFYARAFANQYRSAANLQSLLADYFGIKITILQLQKKRLSLAQKNRIKLGACQHRLGINSLLGSSIWDYQNHFQICLGPLHYAEFLTFLPGAQHLAALIQLTKLYFCMGFSFGIQVILKPEKIPLCRLNGTVRLGYDTWLYARNICNFKNSIIINSAVVASAFRSNPGF